MCLSSHDDYFNFVFIIFFFLSIWCFYLNLDRLYKSLDACIFLLFVKSIHQSFYTAFNKLSNEYYFYFLETLLKYNESIVKALSILRKPILLLPPMWPPRCQQLPRQKSLHLKIVQHHLLNPRRIIATKVPALFRWRLRCQCSYKSTPR